MKTKNVFAGILMVGASFASANANAGYNCKSYDGKASLSLFDDYGLKVIVRNEQGAEILFYAQQTKNDDSYLYSKEEYLLHTPTRVADEAALTVVSRIRSCGRGSCNGTGAKVITAKLKHHDVETNFNCVETSI